MLYQIENSDLVTRPGAYPRLSLAVNKKKERIIQSITVKIERHVQRNSLRMSSTAHMIDLGIKVLW